MRAVTALRNALSGPVRPAVSLGFEEVDACLKGGLCRGALHEVFAVAGHEAAATGFAVGLARRVCGNKRLLWIRQDFSALEFGELSPVGLFEFGLDPDRLLLLQVGDATAALRAGNDALSCAALGAVVIEMPGRPKVLDLVASRRLTLACGQGGVTAFLLRLAAEPDASTAETRWRVRAAPPQAGFQAELLRNRSGHTGCWVMEWNCDDAIFRAAHPGAVVSPASDRQAETEDIRSVA